MGSQDSKKLTKKKTLRKLRMYLLIAGMGALGAMARYGLGLVIQQDSFPVTTLIINVLGCFLLRIAYDYLGRCTSLEYDFVRSIGVGFIGAFTTVSTFSRETVMLIAQGEVVLGGSYAVLTMISCLVASALGAVICEQLLARYMEKMAMQHYRKAASEAKKASSQGGGAR